MTIFTHQYGEYITVFVKKKFVIKLNICFIAAIAKIHINISNVMIINIVIHN